MTWYIFIGLIVFLFLVLRIYYIKGLIDDWNYWLDIYLNSTHYETDYMFIGVEYFENYKLKTWKYWWRLDCWFIHHMVDDNILIQDIHSIKQSNYK